MIDRYTRPEMGSVWTEDARYRAWLRVEIAVCEVLGERGRIPASALQAIRTRAGFDATRIAQIEREVRHDVIAFLTNVAEQVGPDSRWIHYGMTSSDVIDTALALQIREAGALLLAGCDRALAALRARALEHKHTPMVGRTHGIHAEPTTFGLKLLVLFGALRRSRERLATAVDEAAVGKISGAVGTFAHLDPAIEEAVCRKLGIGFEPASTQVVQRDRHAAFVQALALVASVLDQAAVEFRHLARTEVREVEEEFGQGQKGSSAMPHKRNPWRFENLSGLARVVRGYAGTALENLALWHERDISNSSAERIVLPDASIVVDFMLHRFAGLVETLRVLPDRMRENLASSRGLVFSGTLLLALAEQGLAREDAYRLVQGHAMDTWEKGGQFQERVLADPEIDRVLGKEEVERAFDLGAALRNVDAIFARVLGE
ncbi:adenylosuccinate lyase [Myxococcota bacterium]|nr:adenylosuccinate lyase [Myxococcota bacterium]MCZ7618662.1 adenylosuccinate lyase [Myxococcota bacterium]